MPPAIIMNPNEGGGEIVALFVWWHDVLPRKNLSCELKASRRNGKSTAAFFQLYLDGEVWT